MKGLLTIVGGVTGVVAALLWFWAARETPHSAIGWCVEATPGGVPTAKARGQIATRLNTWAAAMTGVSVLLSSLGSML